MFAAIWAALSSPESVEAFAQFVVALLSLFLTIVLPILSAQVYRLIGVKIDEKHMKTLHEAILTWAENAVHNGVPASTELMIADLRAYLLKSVPDAMARLGPGGKVLSEIAGRYIAQIIARK